VITVAEQKREIPVISESGVIVALAETGATWRSDGMSEREKE